MGGAGAPTYVHGPGIDEPLGFGGYQYFIADGLGSIRQIVDAGGNVLNQYRYTAFGKIKQVQAAVGNTYTFTGREWDADAGLYYYRARWYDPDVGRFLAKDPIGFAGGQVDLYGYCLNDPVNLIDPLGLQAHMSFMKQVAKYTNKGIRSALKKLRKNIAEHEKALADPCQSLAKKHHEHELNVFREQLKIVEEEAAKKGLLGAGMTGPFAEDITEEEAEARTSSWFDWIDPNWGVGMAY